LVANTNEYTQNLQSGEDTALHLESHQYRLHRCEDTNIKGIMKYIAMMLRMALKKSSEKQ